MKKYVFSVYCDPRNNVKVEMNIEYVYYYNYYCTNFNSLNRFSVIAVKLTK